MKILVTGGAGYVGSHFVKAAVRRGYDIAVVDNLTTGHLAAIDAAAKFHNADINNLPEMRKIFDAEKPEAVVHFAAYSQVAESVEDPLKYFDNNVGGMICLLKTMVASGVKKLVFSSSAATYGNPAKIPIKETVAQNPINPYGETKLQMEKIMRWCDQAYGVKSVALRYFNVAGAWGDGSIGEDHRPETHLVPNILKAALGEAPSLTIFGDDYATPDGFNVRDYVHPADLAEAHLLAIDYLKKYGRSDVFNLGSSTGFSVKQMLDKAEKIVGKPIPYKIGARRPGDPPILVADSTKARKILHWRPKYDTVEAIIQTAWLWHSSHPRGFDEILVDD
ncbi:MAG: UDP-glucose 4-epimerase GalE [Candidatus Nomurabacteria bacterium]|jgi:UDP-glucose 4-epimerase|nr:UDP-glucose 4-epimerase GalE [Candidatus Nomurabacteria bacterium]